MSTHYDMHGMQHIEIECMKPSEISQSTYLINAPCHGRDAVSLWVSHFYALRRGIAVPKKIGS